MKLVTEVSKWLRSLLFCSTFRKSSTILRTTCSALIAVSFCRTQRNIVGQARYRGKTSIGRLPEKLGLEGAEAGECADQQETKEPS